MTGFAKGKTNPLSTEPPSSPSPQVLTSIQDEEIDMNFEWANKLGNESTWLPQPAPPAAPLMGHGGFQGVSPLASYLAGAGGGSSMASIMPTPQNH